MMNIVNPHIRKGMLLGVTIDSPDINSTTNIVIDAITPKTGIANIIIIKIIRRIKNKTKNISAIEGVFTYLSHIIANKRNNGKM